MIRNRVPRYRNLQNLHVIPTAPSVSIVPSVPIVPPVQITPPIHTASSVLITVKPTTFFPDTKDTRKNMFNQPRNRRHRNRNRRKKDVEPFHSVQTLGSNNDYDWYDSNYLVQENHPPPAENIEEVEISPEVPADEDFEEVEVASVASVDADGDGKQEILVGFRTAKIHYLSYKKISFFRPKIYKFGSQRTLVNCLNVQDNCSVDVDVVSEAEYDEIEYEVDSLDQSESQDQLNEISEVIVKEVDNADDVSSQSIANNSEVNVKGGKEDVKIVNDIKVVNKNDSKTDVKNKINASEIDVKNVKDNSKSGVKSENKDLHSANVKKENHELERQEALKNNDKFKSAERIYQKSIEDNDDIYQGQCIIQEGLDSWKSHLIGLEYLIEIQNKKKCLSAKYHCVLCAEDLQVEELPAVNVINHTNGRKHIVKYLEKHFPSSGFKFASNNDYNLLLLKKICEEINMKLGYSFMCITNMNFYEKHKQKVKEIVQNTSHPNEKKLKLDKNAFQSAVESNLLKDIQAIVSNIVEEVVAHEENSGISKCELTGYVPKKLEKALNAQASTKLEADSVKTAHKKSSYNESAAKIKAQSANTYQKCKGNSALTAFLKLKYARAKFKGSKPVKGPCKTIKEMPTKNVDSGEEKLDDKASNLESAEFEETVSEQHNTDASKEKEMQKTTVHSKHCRKIFVSVIQVIFKSSLIRTYS